MGKKKHNNSASKAHLARQNNENDDDDNQFSLTLKQVDAHSLEEAKRRLEEKQLEADYAASLPSTHIHLPHNNPLCKVVFARRIALFTCRTYLNTRTHSDWFRKVCPSGNSQPSSKARHFVLFAAVNQAFSDAVREYHAFSHYIINQDLFSIVPSREAENSTETSAAAVLQKRRRELDLFVMCFLLGTSNGKLQWMFEEILEALQAYCKTHHRRPNDVYPLPVAYVNFIEHHIRSLSPTVVLPILKNIVDLNSNTTFATDNNNNNDNDNNESKNHFSAAMQQNGGFLIHALANYSPETFDFLMNKSFYSREQLHKLLQCVTFRCLDRDVVDSTVANMYLLSGITTRVEFGGTYCRLSSEGIKDLVKCTSLKEISLAGSLVGDNQIRVVAEAALPLLEHLDISHCRLISEEGIKSFAKMKNLKVLRAMYLYHIPDIVALVREHLAPNLPKLESVEITCLCSDNDFAVKIAPMKAMFPKLKISNVQLSMR